MKYYVYILKGLSNQSFYVGMTTDLQRRLQEHNSGHTITTSKHLPWEIFYTEEFDSASEARKGEKYLKSGAGRRFRMKLFNSGSSVPARSE